MSIYTLSLPQICKCLAINIDFGDCWQAKMLIVSMQENKSGLRRQGRRRNCSFPMSLFCARLFPSDQRGEFNSMPRACAQQQDTGRGGQLRTSCTKYNHKSQPKQCSSKHFCIFCWSRTILTWHLVHSLACLYTRKTPCELHNNTRRSKSLSPTPTHSIMTP